MRNVVICDRETLRCKAWARMCARVAPECEIFAIYEAKPTHQPDSRERRRARLYFRTTDSFSSTPAPEAYVVALRHYRDENIVISPEPRVEIWYGGNGQEMYHQKAWNLVTAIASADAVNELPEAEVEELIRWATAAPLSPRDVPRLLRLPLADDEIHCLYILCQGYLAAWVSPDPPSHRGTACRSDGTLERAVRESGWPAFHRDHSLHPGLASLRIPSSKEELRKKVSDPSWWRIFARPRTLPARVQEEWGKMPAGFAPVAQLLKHMRGKSPISPDVVAEAYLALAARLRAHAAGG
jgi:hypothetical protein